MKLESGVEMKLSTKGHSSVSIIVGSEVYPIGIHGLVKLILVFRGESEGEDLSKELFLDHRLLDNRSYYCLSYKCHSFFPIQKWEAMALMIAAEQLLGEVVLCS